MPCGQSTVTTHTPARCASRASEEDSANPDPSLALRAYVGKFILEDTSEEVAEPVLRR
jgi:hypothetical protein